MVRNLFKDLCEEEEEELKSEKDLSTADTEPTESGITAEHMKLIQELLMELRGGQMFLGAYTDSTLELTVDTALNNLNLEDFPALHTSGISSCKTFFYYIFYVNDLVLPGKWL